MLKNLSKIKFDRCCRKNKAGIQHKLFAEEQFEIQNSNFSSKVFCDSEKKVFSQAKDIQQERKVEKVYRRIPPHLAYIGDSIDQGATRLGGL